MPPQVWKRKALLGGAYALAGSLAAGAGFLAQRRNGAPEPAFTGPSLAPPLAALWAAEFKDLSGKPVRMLDYKGQSLVVNFWATWCGPCIEEMPDFQRASQTEVGKRARFIGIGIDYAAKMKAFSDKIGVTYILLEAGAQGLDIVRAIGNPAAALPFTLIVDRNGAPAMTKIGKFEYAELLSSLGNL